VKSYHEFFITITPGPNGNVGGTFSRYVFKFTLKTLIVYFKQQIQLHIIGMIRLAHNFERQLPSLPSTMYVFMYCTWSCTCTNHIYLWPSVLGRRMLQVHMCMYLVICT